MLRLLVCALFVQACLYIPVIGLYEPVGLVPLHDGIYDTSQLGDGVARAEGYNWGRTDRGRTIIMGHNPGAFSGLDTLQVGDQILLYMDWASPPLEFRVIDIYILPNEGYTDVFTQPIMHYELNLITCYGERWLWVRALPVNNE